MTGLSRIVAGIVAVVLLAGAAAAFAIAWRPAIAAVEPPSPQSFDAALVKKGRDLAAIGNCNDCHTVRGGKNFAGGLPVPTPFGTIFSSNITPDAETGIGRWSEAAFRRAMRSGVNREGQHLYPTFPYDHFTNVSDEDDRALYAFLMTRQPVRARRVKTSFPSRSISGSRLPDGNCFSFVTTPISRTTIKAPNGIAAPIWSKGWRIAAPATRRAMRWVRNAPARSLPAAMSTTGTLMRSTISRTRRCPGTADALFAYLRDGFHPDHGTARGPMAEVVSNLSSVPASDIRAIAVYMAGVSGAPAPAGPERRARLRWHASQNGFAGSKPGRRVDLCCGLRVMP